MRIYQDLCIGRGQCLPYCPVKAISLEEDFVVLVMPSKDINHEGSGPRLRRFLEMALEAGAVKIGDARRGNEYHQGGNRNLLANRGATSLRAGSFFLRDHKVEGGPGE